jgi:prolyl-tRNA editing enzyme YbaK/EbsC (Cys-tRNA(Pro) deacylase)
MDPPKPASPSHGTACSSADGAEWGSPAWAEAVVGSVLAGLDPPVEHEVIPCDPDRADTAAFCEAYGYAPEDSANTIIVAAKESPPRYAACVVLANTRLDVNRTVRKRLGARKASFASAEETKALTGMFIGGVTAIGLPEDLPLWVDAAVMGRPRIILGGGSRSCKVIVPPGLLRRLPGCEVIEGLASPAGDPAPPPPGGATGR